MSLYVACVGESRLLRDYVHFILEPTYLGVTSANTSEQHSAFPHENPHR